MLHRWCRVFFCMVLLPVVTQAVVNEHIFQVRHEAMAVLEEAFRGRFCTEKTFEDAALFIKKSVPPAVHQKILALQAEAEMVRHQIEYIEERVPGMTKESEPIKCLYMRLDLIEKQLDDLIYGGQLIHWKTLLALGLGAAGGVAAFYKTGEARWRNAITVGILTALAVEWVLRGRRSVGLGNMAAGVQWLCRIVSKWVGAVFGPVGFVDRAVAALERALRGAGKKLDKVFHNGWGTAAVCLCAVGLPTAVWAAYAGRSSGLKVKEV